MIYYLVSYVFMGPRPVPPHASGPTLATLPYLEVYTSIFAVIEISNKEFDVRGCCLTVS